MTEQQIIKSQWLGRVYFSRLKVKSLASLKEKDKHECKDFIGSIPENCTPDMYSKCSKVAAAIAQRSAENYIEALENYNKIRMEVESAIEKISDYEYQTLLTSHYIENKTWEVISDEMFYSIRTIKYKHLKALDALQIKEKPD